VRNRKNRRERRRVRKQEITPRREPVTKWFDSDALPADQGRRSRRKPAPPPVHRAAVPAYPPDGNASSPPPAPHSPSRTETSVPPPPVAQSARSESRATRVRPEPRTSNPKGASTRSGRHSAKHRPSKRTPKPPKQRSPRKDAQRKQRRSKRAGQARGSWPVLVAVAVIALGAWWVLSNANKPEADSNDNAPVSAPEVTNTLFVGSTTADSAASWLALLSYDPGEQKGAIVYIPAHTAVEVPGRGLQPIGNALESGGASLLMVSAESLLRISIDHYEQITGPGADALFEQLGPLTVDVPSEVRVTAGGDNARLLFTEGPQELGPEQLVNYLYTVGLEGDDVELGARHLAFWDSLFDEFNANPEVLGASVVAVGSELGSSDASPSENAELLQSLAALEGADLTLTILPVRQVSVGGSELYETDSEEIVEFMDQTLSGVKSRKDDVEVQILNGNGVPGLGVDVAERLVGKGFRVALTGNAGHFGHLETKIVTYDASPEGIAAAERAQRLLGVGRVLVSAQERGIVSVDLTIVVGKDFLRTR
jgi:polyisoprenyl-teichoic acid--peptidoglycan teichoic acid transferase